MLDCRRGIAGLQATIQLGRYRHKVAVVDKGTGRSTLCRAYHNVLGWPDGVSGMELRRLGRMQAERTGVSFVQDEVVSAVATGADFEIACASGGALRGSTLLVATGIMDRFPPAPGLEPCLGLSVYVCPDCDGYEVTGRRTVVMGSGPAGAGMALTLRYWTDRIVYINHEQAVVGGALLEKLQEGGIEYLEAEIAEVLTRKDDGPGAFAGIRLKDGTEVEGERGFLAFGGNAVHSEWTKALGVERLENRHIVTDPRTKMTSVPGVWAAGDIGVHSEQVTIAMGKARRSLFGFIRSRLGGKR
ncbi:NAD(P)/FAD-dependent oxidoreductase [Paenibacillus sp. P26]|nr:NAD(P)/FAD-dependent oxidoreductase [Paenibacillus sp. P26]